MKTTLLTPEKDPMGSAILDYHTRHKASKLRVLSSQFDEDEIPVKQLFRSKKNMPTLEKLALKLAVGRVLDVGAGAGCHTLALQDEKFDVCAIDISKLSVDVMAQRGVKNPRQVDLFDVSFDEKFDTILMLMNGSGIIGKLNRMPQFFDRIKQLLNPNGFVLMDSSDLKYLFEDEDGSYEIDLLGDYYGEVDFQMQYNDIEGESFDWLYVDAQTLAYHAEANGFDCEVLRQGSHYDFLAKLSVKESLPTQIERKKVL
ncbi:MAG: class I SAM-dependent methyltransferase [Rikenellaceae bacterium]